MDNIKNIEQQLIQGNFGRNPAGCAEARAILAGEYSFYCGLLEEILAKKPSVWVKIREKHTSDKQTDQEWEASEMGINETGYKLRLKRIEKMMSALSSLLRVAEGEAKNII